jgi:hypothetical protein
MIAARAWLLHPVWRVLISSALPQSKRNRRLVGRNPTHPGPARRVLAIRYRSSLMQVLLVKLNFAFLNSFEDDFNSTRGPMVN